MSFWMGIQLYVIISLALAGTSYLTIYRPSIELYEEIIEEQNTVYSGWIGFTTWILAAVVIAPYTAYILLQNDNQDFIEELAISLADISEEEEDEE